jgi:hypothetical protein
LSLFLILQVLLLLARQPLHHRRAQKNIKSSRHFRKFHEQRKNIGHGDTLTHAFGGGHTDCERTLCALAIREEGLDAEHVSFGKVEGDLKG